MLIQRTSELSGITRTLDLPVTDDQMRQYLSGEGHIQTIFHNLPAHQREFILTGITDEEWKEMFPTPEDDDTDQYEIEDI
jgi:hypothetical protein